MRKLVIAVAALAASPASAEYAYRTMPSGGSLTVQAYTALNPDCSSMGSATARLVSGPSNGRVSITKGTAYPIYDANNPRHICNTRRMPATVVTYRSQPGYVGSDSFTVQLFFPNGLERNDTFNITIK